MVDLNWKDNQVTSVKIRSAIGGKLHVRSGDYKFESTTKPGEMILLGPNLVLK